MTAQDAVRTVRAHYMVSMVRLSCVLCVDARCVIVVAGCTKTRRLTDRQKPTGGHMDGSKQPVLARRASIIPCERH